MINVYDNLRDDDGGAIIGRTKLFISITDDNGTILRSQSGTLLTPEGTGAMFIVDDWLIPQLDKVIFKDGTLKVKEGEELVEPVKTVLEREEEELLKRLADLRAKKTADTEEVTDEP